MGVFWMVWPLDQQMKEWLEETGVSYPKRPSRWPKGREIKAVLASLCDFDVIVNDNGVGGVWQATIVAKPEGNSSEWTLLNVDQYTGDDEEQNFWFEKGWESLITRILTQLSAYSGPLVLIDDVGGDATVIFSET